MTANVEHLEASFDALDTLEVETLALFLLTDGRPLRGAAGVVDWRLCGELSQALMSGGLTGKLGERLLMPTHGRLGAKRLLVFGAGARGLALPLAELTRCLTVARKAGASDLAVELPENATPETAEQAIRAFDGRRVVLVGASEPLRERLRAAARSSQRA